MVRAIDVGPITALDARAGIAAAAGPGAGAWLLTGGRWRQVWEGDARKLPFPTRFISPVDRRHHTVAPQADWANPPATCPVETPTDEQIAKELGASGIEVLPLEQRIRILAMWDQADAVAKALDWCLAEGVDLFAVRMLAFGAMNWTAEWFVRQRVVDAVTVTDTACRMVLGGLTARGAG